MSTHILIDGKERNRSLLQACNFCNARPGEPCMLDWDEPEKYICPDDQCEQVYAKAYDALSCMMHARTARRKI